MLLVKCKIGLLCDPPYNRSHYGLHPVGLSVYMSVRHLVFVPISETKGSRKSKINEESARYMQLIKQV